MNHALRFNPLRGGIAILNPEVGHFGTLGCVATSDGDDRWIISCYHVLCRMQGKMPKGVFEPVHYAMDLARRAPIALVSSERSDAKLDCAAALVPNRQAVSEILGIGQLRAPKAAKVGMRVLKSGAATGVTEGYVVGVTQEAVEIVGIGYPDEYDLTQEGDSGAIWVDAETNSPTAMHFRGNDANAAEKAFAKPIEAVLQCLDLQLFLG